MIRNAVISADRKYRYSLTREDPFAPKDAFSNLLFVMLNPSTADGYEDDPTLKKCIGFMRRWNYRNLEVVNLFAVRSSDPGAIICVSDPIGPDNSTAQTTALLRAHKVIVGWGRNGRYLDADRKFCELADDWGVELHFLRLTQTGIPMHPLYIPYDIQPIPFRMV